MNPSSKSRKITGKNKLYGILNGIFNRVINKKTSLILIFIFISLLLLFPVSAKIFVTDNSHGIITAPAAAYTNNQLILSSITPETAVTNYLNNQNTIVVGNLNINGVKISARTSSLAKYWTRSDVVVLTTGKDISATYIAIKNNAPLLISGKTLPSATKTELTRLRPKKIIICAPSSSIPTSSLSSFKSAQKVRVWYGSDRTTLINVQKSYPSSTKILAPKNLLPVAMATWKNANFDFSDKVTVNGTSIWSSTEAITSIAMNRYAQKNLPKIYITSDNIAGSSADKSLMERIKKAVAGSANVTIDANSPGPNEASRAIKNAPGGIAAYIAAACPGLMYDITTSVKTGYLKKDASDLSGIVYINYGNLNLGATSYLGRAWDDNFSSVYFSGLYTPSKYLKSAGIQVIEPKIGTSNEDHRVNKIASELIYYAYSSNGEHITSSNPSSLVARHQIDPTSLSRDAQRILNGQSINMDKTKWIYLTSQYVAGLPITNASTSMTSTSSITTSTFSGTLTRTEYREAGKKIYEFMKANKRTPNTVTINGKTLNTADYTKLFAQIVSQHTEKKNMTFPSSVTLNPSIIDQMVNYIQSIM